MSNEKKTMMQTMTRHMNIWFLNGITYAGALGRAVSFTAQMCAQGIRVRTIAPVFIGVQGSSVPIGRRLRP
jgi:hypothetical protein